MAADAKCAAQSEGAGMHMQQLNLAPALHGI